MAMTSSGGASPAPAARPGWREAAVVGVAGFLLFRAATEVVGLLAAYRSGLGSRLAGDPGGAISIWNQWDVEWFSNLARQGYAALGHVSSAAATGVHDGTAFPPAMPALMGAGLRLGVGAEATGFMVSAVALLLALVLLDRLVTLDHGPEIARWAVTLLLVYPFAFFLGTAYAEALVLLGTVGAWLAARRGHWWLAGLAVAVALLAKIVFIILLLPLTLELLGWDGGVRLRLEAPALRRLAALWAAPLVALAAWMAYLQATFGEPLRFLSAQREWGRSLGLPIADIRYALSSQGNLGIRAINAVDAGALVLLAVMTVYVYRRVRRTYGVMLGAFLLVFVLNTSLQSNGRHLALLFPAFIGLATWTEGRRPLRWALVLVQLPLAALLISRFATGHWAG